MPFNLGFGEILLVLLVILLLFGAKRIPEIAGSFGKGIKEFRRSINEVQSSVHNEIVRPDDRDRLRDAPPPPTRAAAEEERPEPKRLMQ